MCSGRTAFVCFARISEQTAIISLYSMNLSVFITEAESVYCAVRTGSSTQTDRVSPLKVNSIHIHNSKLRRAASPSECCISIERVSIECCMADVGNFNLLFLKATKNFCLKVPSYENLVRDMKYLAYRMFAYKV